MKRRFLAMALVFALAAEAPISILASENAEVESEVVEATETEEVEVEEPEAEAADVVKAEEAEADEVTVVEDVTVGAATEEDEILVEEPIIVSASAEDNDELFEEYIQEQLVGADDSTSSGSRARRSFTFKSEFSETVFNLLCQKIEDVAANGGSTEFTLTPEDFGGVIFEDTVKISESTQWQTMFAELDSIVDQLLIQYPYELYWFNKTALTSHAYGSSYTTYHDGSIAAQVTRITFSFPVADSYAVQSTSESGAVTIDNTKVRSDVASVSTAVATAKQVVADNASKDDEAKLTAYKEYICDAVTYDRAAADGSDNDDDCFKKHIDSWQLISVFDGVEATNVVCEGYSKAFQYLCDLSDFRNEDTACYTVTGTMAGGTGAGGHMWNVVTVNGANTIADITNSDGGSIGQNGGLFLESEPSSQVACARYVFKVSNTDITYIYDEDMRTLYTAEQLTIGKLPKLIDSASLVLTDGIAVRFYLNKAKLDALNSPVVTVNGEVLEGEETSDGYVTYTFRNITPKEMGKELKLEVTADNEVKGSTSYSIKQYCENMRKSDSASDELKALCTSLLNYGAESQTYMNYDTTNLVNSSLSDSEKSLAPVANSIAISKVDPQGDAKAKLKSAKLMLGDKVNIRFTFTLNDGVQSSDVTPVVKVNGTAVTSGVGEITQDDNGRYYVTYKFDKASDFDKKVEFGLYDSSMNTLVSEEVTYSVKTYCERMQSRTDVGNLCKAIAAYVDCMTNYAKSV